jgi:hypothetical protein
MGFCRCPGLQVKPACAPREAVLLGSRPPGAVSFTPARQPNAAPPPNHTTHPPTPPPQPHIAEGSWVIKSAVGTTPVIVGRKLASTFYITGGQLPGRVSFHAFSARRLPGMDREAGGYSRGLRGRHTLTRTRTRQTHTLSLSHSHARSRFHPPTPPTPTPQTSAARSAWTSHLHTHMHTPTHTHTHAPAHDTHTQSRSLPPKPSRQVLRGLRGRGQQQHSQLRHRWAGVGLMF